MIQVNTFISSLKNVFKRGCMLLGIFVTAAGIVQFLNFLYVDAYGYEWSRTLNHYFYQEENVDNLFLGSSHVFLGTNPELLNELNGKNNFNISTTGQRLDASYYWLKEVVKYHELEHVYLELYYKMSVTDADGMNAVWWASDYMKTSKNRLEYIYHTVPAKQYMETFLPFLRYRSKLFDVNYLKEQLTYKMSDAYKKCAYREAHNNGEVLEYRPNGYWYTTITLKDDRLFSKESRALEEEPMLEKYEQYLRKIIELCQEEGIDITLYSAPMYELKLLAMDNYDAYIRQIESIANQYNIEYYDFNLVSEDVLPIQSAENFYDLDHLNSAGAEIFTYFFHKVMQGTPEENEKYFYDTYAEKLAAEPGKVYGFLCVEENKRNEKWKIASNWSEGMEYRILLTPSGEDTEMVQDFSKEPYITISKKENGICTIVSRRIGEPDSVSTFEVEY